jgi:LysM repeat protein
VEINSLSNPNSLKVGQVILIPPHARSGGGSPSPAPAPAARISPATGGNYVVLPGDSLSKIASKHGVKVNDIKRANNLTGDLILVGQKLTIPGASSAPTAVARPQPRPRPATSIADEIDVLSLAGDETSDIPVIVVPDTSTSMSIPAIPATNTAPQNKPIPYTVLAGDTLDEIAKLFIVSKADIMELNGLGPSDPLTEGQKLLIPPSDL